MSLLVWCLSVADCARRHRNLQVELPPCTFWPTLWPCVGTAQQVAQQSQNTLQLLPTALSLSCHPVAAHTPVGRHCTTAPGVGSSSELSVRVKSDSPSETDETSPSVYGGCCRCCAVAALLCPAPAGVVVDDGCCCSASCVSCVTYA